MKWKLKVNRGEVLKIKDVLIIMMNKKCGYGCEHCLFDCSPDSNIKPDEERLSEVLNNISNDVKKIHFSGGEPFENFELLKECVKISRRKNKKISCRTSCFWADDYETTLSFLKELKQEGLVHLIIDLDGISLRPDKVQNYKNVIDVAGEIRIKITFNITKTEGKMLGDEINLLGYRVLNKSIHIVKSTKNMNKDELKQMHDETDMKKAMVLETDGTLNWFSKGVFYSQMNEKEVGELME